MNNVYIVAPTLTLGISPAAETFAQSLHCILSEYNSVSILKNDRALRATEPDRGDAVIIFNRPDQNYDAASIQLLDKSLVSGASIFPVATDKLQRHPPRQIEQRQNFDIVENLRQRALEPSQTQTIATVFARQILSELRPTFNVEPMHLFLSHRRLDGEEITSQFHKLLQITAQKAFRDLLDVRVGEDAQDVIDARLRESDAVIFLDTPKAGESKWILKELQTALGLQLPVVWVRIGPDEGRVPLTILPSGVPHFSFPGLDPASGAFTSESVDEIVQKAFDIHHRDYVDRLLDELRKLETLAASHGIALKRVDDRRMIYSLSLPRKAERYRQRPLMHLLQLFGRTPTPEDIQNFAGCAKEAGFESHPQHGPHYDSAILLAAMPTRTTALLDTSGVHTDSIADYVAEIQRGVAPPAKKAKRLVISGAFPDCEPEFQQNMTNAVYAFVEASLRAGIGISFGAHPTFQFMIFEMAKRLRPSDHLAAVRMYISRFFVTDATIDEFRNDTEVLAVDANGDRASSLSRMREAMMRDPDAGALVVIGGKKTRPGIPPGVDEEIALAREAGLPVYIIGSVGGRSSELISGLNLKERGALNDLPEAMQDLLASSLDYAALAQLIVTTSF
jgi:hypothetical protein